MDDKPTAQRSLGQWLVGIIAAIGIVSALIWRVVWPVTGMTADLIFIGVMIAGGIAAKLARWF
jgi:hypothetical protein